MGEVNNNELVARTLLVFWVAGCASVLVDLDHIWSRLGLEEPFNLTGWIGRPFHHPVVCGLFGIVCAVLMVALVSRWNVSVSLRGRVIERRCVVCGEPIEVIVYSDQSYSGGHFFGEIQMIADEEYWECDECYKKDWCLDEETDKEVDSSTDRETSGEGS